MKVRLLKSFPTLGQAGSIVNVSQGYAFNYLLPKKIACTNLEEKKINGYSDDHAVILSEQNKLDLHKIAGLKLEIKVKTNDQGRLYESIKPGQIAQLLRQRKNINVTAKQIIFNNSIKEVGNFELLFKIANQSVKFNLIVTKL